MDFKEELIQIGFRMKEKSDFFHKQLKALPPGTLQIVNGADGIRLSQITMKDGKVKRKGIGRHPEIVKALIRKAYYKEAEKRLNKNITILKRAIKKMDELSETSILRNMPANYSLIEKKFNVNWVPAKMHPVFTDSVCASNCKLNIDENEVSTWGEKPYMANNLFNNRISNKTEEGFAMRSKSEVAIFACYKRLGIPTHYDEVINFRGILKSPDFVSVRYDGKVIYHEHCGKVNDLQYMIAHNEKMKLYESCGIVPWDNLIVTYESPNGGIDLKLTEALIKSFHKK